MPQWSHFVLVLFIVLTVLYFYFNIIQLLLNSSDYAAK